ncbi:hypothetical protein [Fimbriimonas ginsengisoli]|uniref:Uncharacterized protein n=1 Tax=Fimbriimonas ginsengisoli Gsoil 348 TaxID=661478 RepID=A0A068NUE2_FIMGI|nr:hypothetical protein [Fimbriimonas ginsengisoli]AIE86977.1 hypothetical protein OP10G_3609 [Fimbriimonas ginsengisoli Gsoil 348]
MMEFLEAFAEGGNVAQACRVAGIHRSTYSYWLKNDLGGFQARFEEARLSAVDVLEAEARRRAVEGVPRLKFDTKTGQPYVDPRTSAPYEHREYSDALLVRLLVAHNPERFSERMRVDVKQLDDETILRLLKRTAVGGSGAEGTAEAGEPSEVADDCTTGATSAD